VPCTFCLRRLVGHDGRLGYEKRLLNVGNLYDLQNLEMLHHVIAVDDNGPHWRP
jgi:hypothetical protein